MEDQYAYNSSAPQIDEKLKISEILESASSECTGITIDRHPCLLENNKNGVFHEDSRPT